MAEDRIIILTYEFADLDVRCLLVDLHLLEWSNRCGV